MAVVAQFNTSSTNKEGGALVKNMVFWLLVPGFPAAALVAASYLKIYQLTVDPFYRLPFIGSRWMTLGIAQVELLIGLWLISGVGWRWAKWVGIVSYGILAAVSFVQVLNGAESCGCFGRLKIDPSYMLAFDVLALFILTLWRPAMFCLLHRTKLSIRSKAIATASILLAASQPMVVAWAETLFRSSASVDEAEGKLVILEPENWLGKPVPILRAIESSQNLDLANGEWVLVFYQPNCHECHKFLEEVAERLSGYLPPGHLGRRIVIIEVARRGSVQSQGEPFLGLEGAAHGWMKAKTDWFMQTPIAVRIINGEAVKSTKNPVQAAAWSQL